MEPEIFLNCAQNIYFLKQNNLAEDLSGYLIVILIFDGYFSMSFSLALKLSIWFLI